jgi:hypothetical protein
MPNTTQIADLLFKKQLGLGTTQSGRQFFEEPIRGRAFVVNTQIWQDSPLIPNVAPSISTGVVQKLTDYPLVAVGGTSNSFSGELLVDAIPFNWGDGTSYNYAVKDSTAGSISFGSNDWTVDTEAGILMFNNGVPANMPPTISFFRYSGSKGVPNTGLLTGNFYPLLTNPSGYVTTGQTGKFLDTGSVMKFRVLLTSGVENQYVNYPYSYDSRPTTVACEFENDIDNYVYTHAVSSVSNSGLLLHFSDNLSNIGYIANITLIK